MHRSREDRRAGKAGAFAPLYHRETPSTKMRGTMVNRDRNDELEERGDAWLHWASARWALLVFNVAVATGCIFWLMWTGRGFPWVVWTTRILIAVQITVAVLNLLFAYRLALTEENSPTIVTEAWAYMVMTALCCFAMGLSMV